jgi:hypothetical protein
MGEQGSTAGCGAIGWIHGYRGWCMMNFCTTDFHGRWRWRCIGVQLRNFKSSCLVFVLSENHVTFAVFRLIILSPAVISAFYFRIYR